MSDNEKIILLEEAFDVDEGTLKPEMCLNDIDEFDSMTKLALIVMIDENFGKTITGTDINEFKTVQDIMNIMA